MRILSHQEQKDIWDREHAAPKVLLQMDSSEPSSGVVKFFQWLTSNNIHMETGVEMGCGKGRSVIWLAKQGKQMTGFDFSPTAIKTAQKRATQEGVDSHITLLEQDATAKWQFPDDSFDFALDCFASTDIESLEGRLFAAKEMERVVKPGGLILVYAMSTDDQFHQEMIVKSPTKEVHAFLHETGKFEKVFTLEELKALHQNMEIVVAERIPKKAIFFGKEYQCNHHWVIFRKPLTS